MMQTTVFRAMGCDVQVMLLAPNEITAVLSELPSQFYAWEQTFSRFLPSSELSVINAQLRALWGVQDFVTLKVSSNFFSVLTVACQQAKRTQGLVNPCVLPALLEAGYTKDFAALISQPNPTDEFASPSNPTQQTQCGQYDISASKHQVDPKSIAMGWQDIVLQETENKVTLPTNIQLDLSGFVKGWCADILANELMPFASGLINVGGDIATFGAQPFTIGVASPNRDVANSEHLAIIDVQQGAIATSGQDFRQWHCQNQHKHHLIDPFTALPSTSNVLSVTVKAASCVVAESAAKQAFLLGYPAGWVWLNDNGYASIMVTVTNEVYADPSFIRLDGNLDGKHKTSNTNS